MFWNYAVSCPQIDTILCKEDLTLKELLDQDNVIQELKAQNTKLIEFLIKPEILHELVDLILTLPSPETDISEQYKYANIACELLTSDLPAMNERLASALVLQKLYGFLEGDGPLNPLLSSYFSRTFTMLISRKSEQNWYSYQYTCLQALEFLKGKERFIELLLTYIGTSPLMDFIHNLFTLIEGDELRMTLWEWLSNQEIVPRLIKLLGPSSDNDRIMNAASVVGSVIQRLRDQLSIQNDKSETDPILNMFRPSEIVTLLLETVFSSDTICDTSLENGIDVLLLIMQPYLPGDAKCRQTLSFSVHDRPDSTSLLSSTLKCNGNAVESATDDADKDNTSASMCTQFSAAIFPYIKKLKDILNSPVSPNELTSGILNPPLGKIRLHVAKFISVLVSLNSKDINNEIIRCDIPELLLNLFCMFPCNNFLHTEVEKLVAYSVDQVQNCVINENDDCDLITHLMKKCNLLNVMMTVWEENDEDEKCGSPRKGYMGHVIRICILLCNESNNNPEFAQLLNDSVASDVLEKWNLLRDNKLKSIIEKYSTCLGGIRPKMFQSSSDYEDRDLKLFPTDDDDRGLSNNDDDDSYDFENRIEEEDDEKKDYEAKIKGMSKIDDDNDDYEDDEDKKENIFNKVCKQKWQSYRRGLDSLPDDEDLSTDVGGGFSYWIDHEGDIDDENLQRIGTSQEIIWSVPDPWSANASFNSSDDNNSIWNSSVDSNNTNWANFDDGFINSSTCSDGNGSGVGMNSNDENDSSVIANSTLNSGNELFGLLNQSGCENLAAFSSLDLSNGNSSDYEDKEGGGGNLTPTATTPSSAHANNNMNGIWSGLPSSDSESSFDRAMSNNGGGSVHTANMNTIFDLESICGNTLAEKIANAQNDIRQDDENRLRRREKQQLWQSEQKQRQNGGEHRSEIDVYAAALLNVGSVNGGAEEQGGTGDDSSSVSVENGGELVDKVEASDKKVVIDSGGETCQSKVDGRVEETKENDGDGTDAAVVAAAAEVKAAKQVLVSSSSSSSSAPTTENSVEFVTAENSDATDSFELEDDNAAAGDLEADPLSPVYGDVVEEEVSQDETTVVEAEAETTAMSNHVGNANADNEGGHDAVDETPNVVVMVNGDVGERSEESCIAKTSIESSAIASDCDKDVEATPPDDSSSCGNSSRQKKSCGRDEGVDLLPPCSSTVAGKPSA